MIDQQTLKDALMRSGRGRDLALPGSEAVLERWRAGLEEFVDYYSKRFGETVNPFDWWNANSAKARAFFEPDTLSLSPEMKAAVWRILLGFDIRKVELIYQPEARSSLHLDLSAPDSTNIEPYVSNLPEDAKLLRHLGSIRVDGRFEFQGYHAFAVPAVA